MNSMMALTFRSILLSIGTLIYGLLSGWTFSRFGKHPQEIYDKPFWRLKEIILKSDAMGIEELLYNFIYRLPYYPTNFVFLYKYIREAISTLVKHSEVEKSSHLQWLRVNFKQKPMPNELSTTNIVFIFAPIIVGLSLPVLVFILYYLYSLSAVSPIGLSHYMIEIVFVIVVALCPLGGYWTTTTLICKFFPLGRSVYEGLSKVYWINLGVWSYVWSLSLISRINEILSSISLVCASIFSLYTIWTYGIKKWASFLTQ